MTAAAQNILAAEVLKPAPADEIRTLIVGLAVIALSALAPAIREFWHQDRCLDAGGAWQKSTFRCIHESEDLESGGSFP